jgi:hypothetical protein
VAVTHVEHGAEHLEGGRGDRIARVRGHGLAALEDGMQARDALIRTARAETRGSSPN